MTDVLSDTTDTTPSVKESATRIRSATTPVLGAAATSLQDAYDAVKEAAGEVFGETKTQFDRLTSEAGERVHSAYGDVEAYVQLRPARAIGIAAGVGVLIGLFMRGRRKTVYLRDRV